MCSYYHAQPPARFSISLGFYRFNPTTNLFAKRLIVKKYFNSNNTPKIWQCVFYSKTVKLVNKALSKPN